MSGRRIAAERVDMEQVEVVRSFLPQFAFKRETTVAVNEPATPLASNAGDVAMPFASVTSVACAPPATKLAPALPAPAPPPRLNVTVVPWIGLPPAPVTSTRSGLEYCRPDVSERCFDPSDRTAGGSADLGCARSRNRRDVHHTDRPAEPAYLARLRPRRCDAVICNFDLGAMLAFLAKGKFDQFHRISPP